MNRAFLRAKALSRKMLNIVRSMYENVLCCVRGGCVNIDCSGCSAGVEQGSCLLGPNLFGRFINGVAEELRNDGRHRLSLTTLIVCRIDDVALVSHTVTGLQNQLNAPIRASDRPHSKPRWGKTN